jgi:hypothetical protein
VDIAFAGGRSDRKGLQIAKGYMKQRKSTESRNDRQQACIAGNSRSWMKLLNAKLVPAMVISIFILVAIPTLASANAGTTLLWFQMFHLVIGNALIGLVEGNVIAWQFKTPKLRTIGLAVAANYFSAIVSLISISSLPRIFLPWFSGENLFHFGLIALTGLITLSYGISIVLEWPFYHLAPEEKSRRSWTISFKSSALAQTVSYALIIIPLYYIKSPISFLTKTHLAAPTASESELSGWVYFINNKGSEVLRVRTSGGPAESVVPLRGAGEYANLFLKASMTQKDRCELWLMDRDQAPLQLQPTLPFKCELPTIPVNLKKYPTDSWFDFGDASFFATKSKRCSLRTDFWPTGLSFECPEKDLVRLSFQTPFVQWYFRSAFLISEKSAIFQGGGFGSDATLFKMNLMSRVISVLANGYGPTVAREIP